jgi:arylsulfatase A-like enzyme
MGKWHMGSDPYNAPQHGYDEVVGAGHFPSPCRWGYYYPGANNVCPGGADGQHLDDFVTDKAVAFMQKHAGDPFLLMLNLYDVHTPIQGKPELIEKYRAKREPYSAPQSHPVYAAMVEEVDICVGRVMDALDDLGIADNTMLVFFSDNGGDMYDKPDGVLPTSNAPLRAGKANLYEGGTREPLVVAWPERVPAGVRSDAFFSSVDFYPTFLEMAGIAVPHGHAVDGVSQVPVLSGTAESVRDEIFCFFPHYTPATGQLPSASLRIGGWKLIRYFHDNPDQTHRYELFHLGDDPGEAKNLADQEPDRVAEMDARIEWYLSDTGCLVPVPSESYDRHAEKSFDGWRNAVVVDNEKNPVGVSRDGLCFDATSFGPAFLCEEIPESSGELTLTLGLQSPVGGSGQVSWHEEGQALPGNAFFSYEGSDAQQSIEIALPCRGALSALRLEPSRLPGPMVIRSVCLMDAGDCRLRLWDFSTE